MAEAGLRGQRRGAAEGEKLRGRQEADRGPRPGRRGSQQRLVLPDLQQGYLQGLGSGPKGKRLLGLRKWPQLFGKVIYLLGGGRDDSSNRNVHGRG